MDVSSVAKPVRRDHVHSTAFSRDLNRFMTSDIESSIRDPLLSNSSNSNSSSQPHVMGKNKNKSKASNVSKDGVRNRYDCFLRALQFMNQLSTTAWSKYQEIYFINRGATPSQLGVLSTTRWLVQLVSHLLWGFLADYTGDIKLVLLIDIAIFTILIYFWQFVSLQTTPFIVVFGLAAAVNSTYNVANLSDTITLNLITNSAAFGKYRMFGALAYGIGCVGIGYLIDWFGINVIFTYSYFAASIFFAYIFVFMPRATVNPTANAITKVGKNDKLDKPQHLKRKKNLAKLMRIIFCNASLMRSLMSVSIYAFLLSLADNIIPIQLENDFKAPRKWIGLSQLFATFSEYPFFFFSDRLLSKFNYNFLFSLSHIILCLRYVANYAITANFHRNRGMNTDVYYWLLCGSQLLCHGINWALFWSTLCVYVRRVSEIIGRKTGNDWHATLQGVLEMVRTFSVGCGVAFWLWFFNVYDSETMYLVGATITALVTALYACLFQWDILNLSKLK